MGDEVLKEDIFDVAISTISLDQNCMVSSICIDIFEDGQD
jgi:hypothetical protein